MDHAARSSSLQSEARFCWQRKRGMTTMTVKTRKKRAQGCRQHVSGPRHVQLVPARAGSLHFACFRMYPDSVNGVSRLTEPCAHWNDLQRHCCRTCARSAAGAVNGLQQHPLAHFQEADSTYVCTFSRQKSSLTSVSSPAHEVLLVAVDGVQQQPLIRIRNDGVLVPVLHNKTQNDIS